MRFLNLRYSHCNITCFFIGKHIVESIRTIISAIKHLRWKLCVVFARNVA